MGKPFGLLNRIFSFSKGSKRNGSNFDHPDPNEYGQEPDIHDPDKTLNLTGSVRTTGGIGGLGRGITNAASEMSRSNTASADKGGEKGLRKRLLRRASMSASDLLSWGQEKYTKHESRVASHGGAQNHQALNDSKPYESFSHILGRGIEEPHETFHEPVEHERKHNISHYNDRVVEGLVLGNGSGGRGKRVHSSLRIQSPGNEELNRLLRTSSANYRVIKETDYRDMDPLDHPINAIALTRSPSIPLLFSSGRSNPPTAWTSQPQPDSLAFPSPQLPLTHTPSTSSTTSTSTYKVTLHRRRIHSRTSFPEANRALDHLHSSSPIAALDSPSDSPHSSSECLDRPHAEVAPNAIPVKPTGISKIRNQNNATPGTVFPPKGRWPQSQRGQPPPSLLPPRSSARQPPAQKTVAEEAKFRHSMQNTTSDSQIYPVAPLRTVPPTSQRSNSKPFGAGLKPHGNSQVDKPSIRLLYSQSGSSSRTSMIESAIRYTTPLKGSEISIANEDAYDGIVEEKAEGDQQASPRSTLTQTPVKMTPAKIRNVLKKKRRESQGSITLAGRDASSRASSIKSGKSAAGDESKSEKSGSRSNLRSVLGVIQAVGSVVERLHGSAVGEEALTVPRRQYTGEWDMVSPNDLPTMPEFNSYQITPPPVKRDHYCTTAESPLRRARLARLRRDPSVVSLLDMYKADGTLKEGAFSNTPPAKPLQRAMSERGSKPAERAGVSTDEINHKNRKGELGGEARRAQMRSVYAEAFADTSLDERPQYVNPRRQPVTPLKEPAKSTEKIAGIPSPKSRSSSFTSLEPIVDVKRSALSNLDRSKAAAPETPSRHLDFSSVSSDNEPSLPMVDTSLYVEPGSLDRFDDTSCESSPVIETPVEAWLDAIHTPVKSHHYQIDLERNKAEDIPRSPNRRASEVFAFLGPVTKGSDESLEVGATGYNEKTGIISLESYKPTKDVGKSHLDNMQTPTTTRLAQVSPSKRPLGPRGTVRLHASPSADKKNSPFIRPSVEVPPISSEPLSVPSVTPSEHDSAEPLTGATFTSDSFASQNTTDRSLYRGIYKYLNETPSFAGRSKVTRPSKEDSLIDIPVQSPSKERNPFIATTVDVDKSLPITPSSPSGSDAEWEEYTRNFLSLRAISPLSPFVDNLTSVIKSPELDQSPRPPSPCDINGGVKQRIAMWESTKPLEIDDSSVQKRSPRPNHLTPSGKSVRWSEATSTSKSGLGDGRAFNSSPAAGKMYGPRALSPAKRSAAKPVSRRPTTINVSTNGNKPTDVTQGYPFSQDLFPAILSPGGPAVAKPNSLLQTPQRHTANNDPSPASSSKLGAYGREIMALARSKSGARVNHTNGKPL